jgi:hypothetical protein
MIGLLVSAFVSLVYLHPSLELARKALDLYSLGSMVTRGSNVFKMGKNGRLKNGKLG